MPEDEEIPPRPTRETIVEQIRRALGPGGTTIPTVHLVQRLSDRGRDMQDVLRVLEAGRVRENKGSPRYDHEHRAWTCQLDGQDMDGRPFSVVIGLIGRSSISLITAYPTRRQKP